MDFDDKTRVDEFRRGFESGLLFLVRSAQTMKKKDCRWKEEQGIGLVQ